MGGRARRVLESLNADEFPILHRLLNSDFGGLMLEELQRLLERRFTNRAERYSTNIMARIRSDTYDEAVVIRNVSTSGALVVLEPSTRIALQDETLHLRVRTLTGLVDLPVDFVRVANLSRGQVEAAFTFHPLTEQQQMALVGLSNLLYPRDRAVPAINSENP